MTTYRAVLALLVVTAAPLAAQPTLENPLRVTVMTGGLSPLSSVIVAPNGGDTRLGAAPAFGLDLQYRVGGAAALYGSGAFAFGTLHHGSSLGAGSGSSSDATIIAGTAGIVLDAPSDWFGSAFRPMVRLGGGIKAYSFGVAGASSLVSPTGDFGLGFRAGSGAIEVGAEVRFLPSAFDQAKLPTRGIQAQDQRQIDLLFGIGVTVRP
jgi:hypothetical protein